jgi:hypothetical protein
VQVALWYQLRNNPMLDDRDVAGGQRGLVNTKFARAPAYCAFMRYARDSSLPDLCDVGLP